MIFTWKYTSSEIILGVDRSCKHFAYSYYYRLCETDQLNNQVELSVILVDRSFPGHK